MKIYYLFRSSRVEPPELTGLMRSTDDIIESMVCPPPPSDPPMISEEMISGLIVPAPGETFSRKISGKYFKTIFLENKRSSNGDGT